MAAFRARQPKALLQTDIFSVVPPQDIVAQDLSELASSKVIVNPAKVLGVYLDHVSCGDDADVSVLIRAFTQLGFLFDPNSFFSTADKQILTRHRHFRSLAHDLTEARHNIPDAAAPVLLYSMASLEYRCAPLLPALLEAVERNLFRWRSEVLSLLLYSCACLGIGTKCEGGVRLALPAGDESRDFSHLCIHLAQELGSRSLLALAEPERQSASAEEVSFHDWARAAFAVAMTGQYNILAAPRLDTGATAEPSPVLPALAASACSQLRRPEDLDASGWAQFFLYQTLYAVDVEKPQCEEAVKRAMPMWIQERLHARWLDSIILHGQPQGADDMQRDVDRSLKRTHTQALLNCSAGRDWDEQHCWFCGFLLKPKISLECDSLLPLGPGRPWPSGWLQMKTRILRKMGYQVATIHRCFWEKLTEDQKDEQIMQLRVRVRYEHDDELERQQRKIRQTPHTRGNPATKKKDWQYQPPPAPAP